MTTSFIKDMMDEANEKAKNKPDSAFKFGYMAGMILVLAGVVSLEALFVAATAGVLGLSLSWFQGLSIVLFVKWLRLNFN